MAAIKTQPMSSADRSPVRYHVTGGQGNHITLKQSTLSVATPNALNAGTTNFIEITDGSAVVRLTQQNAADLGPAITNFGSTGVLS